MNRKSPKLRIGNGYDIHRLARARKLILGGVLLEHPDNLGLDGHSDADVLTHSIMDALLGALSLGDIGKYFPPSEGKWKDANSLILLSKVIELIRKEGWEVNNIDSVVVAERPKIKPYLEQMKKNISNILQIDDTFIGIKATTNEKYISLLICLFVFLFQSNFQTLNALPMKNYQNEIVIEELRLKVPSKFKEVWLKAEKQVWEPWLSIQEGYLGRQIFWDKDKEEALILVNWKNKKLWKSISMQEVDKVQEKFEENVMSSVNVSKNPFKLIYEGELEKQV